MIDSDPPFALPRFPLFFLGQNNSMFPIFPSPCLFSRDRKPRFGFSLISSFSVPSPSPYPFPSLSLLRLVHAPFTLLLFPILFHFLIVFCALILYIAYSSFISRYESRTFLCYRLLRLSSYFSLGNFFPHYVPRCLTVPFCLTCVKCGMNSPYRIHNPLIPYISFPYSPISL